MLGLCLSPQCNKLCDMKRGHGKQFKRKIMGYRGLSELNSRWHMVKILQLETGKS